MRITCPCSKDSKKITKTNSVGDIVEGTGFSSVLTHVGKIIYLCPECNQEARYLASKLLSVVKDKNLYFPSLINR